MPPSCNRSAGRERRERRARQSDVRGQLVDRPGGSRVVVHQLQRVADPRLDQRPEPARCGGRRAGSSRRPTRWAPRRVPDQGLACRSGRTRRPRPGLRCLVPVCPARRAGCGRARERARPRLRSRRRLALLGLHAEPATAPGDDVEGQLLARSRPDAPRSGHLGLEEQPVLHPHGIENIGEHVNAAITSG